MRGKGEGSVYKEASSGLWVGTLELPPLDGKRRRKVIRSKTKSVVLDRMSKLRDQLGKTGDLPTESQTVAVWLDYWMREIAMKTRRPQTVTSYKSVIGQHIIPEIGKVRLDKVTPATVRRVTARMETMGLSSTYQRNTFAVMSAAFRAAEREGRMPRNPCELMDAPRKAMPELEVLTPLESIKLLESFQERPDAFLWATFILTGARRGEILGLEWDRVTDELDLSWQLQRLPWSHGCGGKCTAKRAGDCPQRKLNVPADFEYRQLEGGLYLTRPKSRAGWRVIPLVEPLASILGRWRDVAPQNPYGLLFTSQGGTRPIDPNEASSEWPEVLRAAGVNKNVRLHDLRHGTADLLYDAGIEEDIITLILGHSDRATSRGYRSKGNRPRLRAAMQKLSTSLGYPSLEN